MPRGDIHYERFLINDPNGTGTDIDFDSFYFTVKKTSKDRLYLFQKSLKNGTVEKLGLGDYQIKIEPSDTNKLLYGDYIFDVNVKYKNLIDETWTGKFVLTDEVTFTENE